MRYFNEEAGRQNQASEDYKGRWTYSREYNIRFQSAVEPLTKFKMKTSTIVMYGKTSVMLWVVYLDNKNKNTIPCKSKVWYSIVLT